MQVKPQEVSADKATTTGRNRDDWKPSDFRRELVKLMPGYQWTVHQNRTSGSFMSATGIQSRGFNRISTLHIERRAGGGEVLYVAKSAGTGRRAPWLYTEAAPTLARALRGLQQHYESAARTYSKHASDLQKGRATPPAAEVFERSNERTLTSTLLISASHFAVEVTPELIASWSDAECQAVEDYCLAIHYRASDNPGVVIPPRPAVLGGAA